MPVDQARRLGGWCCGVGSVVCVCRGVCSVDVGVYVYSGGPLLLGASVGWATGADGGWASSFMLFRGREMWSSASTTTVYRSGVGPRLKAVPGCVE